MKLKNYKTLLDKLDAIKPVFVTISMWTYSSKRITMKVAFKQLAPYVDGDMIFNYSDRKMKLTDVVTDKKFAKPLNQLKIAKVDFVEIHENLLHMEHVT